MEVCTWVVLAHVGNRTFRPVRAGGDRSSSTGTVGVTPRIMGAAGEGEEGTNGISIRGRTRGDAQRSRHFRRAFARNAVAVAAVARRQRPRRCGRGARRRRQARHPGQRGGAGRTVAARPLAARRGHPVDGDGRGGGGTARRVAAAVPVLLDRRRRGFRDRHRRPGQRGTGGLRGGCTGQTGRTGVGPAGLARRGRGRALRVGRFTDGRHRHRQPRRWPGPGRSSERRPVGIAVRTRHLRLSASQWRAGSGPAARFLAAPTRRLSDGDSTVGGPVGVRPGAGAVPA